MIFRPLENKGTKYLTLILSSFTTMKFLPFFALALLVFACHKDKQDCPPDLPCTSQVGANTFGCYINGKPWVADIAPYMLDPTLHQIEAEYDESGYRHDLQNQLRITASRWDSTSSAFMTLYVLPVEGVGELTPGVHKFSAWGNILDKSISPEVLSFDLDTIMDYSMKITHLDPKANTISGVFSFKGISSNDTMVVTDGRFDVKYYPN